MFRFDRVLIDPTPESLNQILAEAATAANKGYRTARVLHWPANDSAAFLVDWQRASEGHRQWNGPGTYRKIAPVQDSRSVAGIAWWSDPLGRKHCRVVADRVECGSAAERSLLQPDLDRPCLSCVYPDDLYLREESGKWRLWAACRCGASGPPETLGWMGPWCAACHDRTESGIPQTRPDVYPPVVLPCAAMGVLDLAFIQNGRSLLAWVDGDPWVWVWSTVTGRVRKRLCRDFWVNAFAVAPDGRKFAICDHGQLRSYSLIDGTGGPIPSSPLSNEDHDIAIAFNPDGTLLALACVAYPAQLALHDCATGQLRWTQALGDQLRYLDHRCLTFSPDGRTLALGWCDPMVRLWDVTTGRRLPPLPGNSRWVSMLAYSPDGQSLAVALNDQSAGRLLLWDVSSGTLKASFEEPVGRLAFSPDSRLLATVGADGCLRLREVADGHLLGAFRWHYNSDLEAVAFSPDGRWLATGAEEDRIKLWPVDALLAQQEPPTPHRKRQRGSEVWER